MSFKKRNTKPSKAACLIAMAAIFTLTATAEICTIANIWGHYG